MNKLRNSLLFVLCCGFTLASAQTRISGHVFNRNDGPVMMANVVEVDKDNKNISAATTDMSGNFTMTIKNPGNTLKVSYIGYQVWQQTIGNRTSFRIELLDRTREIKPATVTARKVVKTPGLAIPEREMASAMQTLNMDEMKGLSFTSADQALQGQIAGLDIVTNSGNLGSGTSMRLRGTTTITGDQNPLIVVDGNILESYNATDIDLQDMDNTEQFAQLLSVNPEDIQSIDVLKDAATSALWGSRGANGVIEIKTRRGRRGPAQIEFSYRFSGSWQPAGYNMLNGDGYTMMLKEAYFNPKQNDMTSNIVELSYNRDRTLYYANFNKNTDWVNAVTQFGQNHEYNVNLTGGGEKATFRISAGYSHQTGSIIEQSMDRFTSRLALDYAVSDRIRFSSNFSLTYTNNLKNYTGILNLAYKAMPNMSVTRYEYDRATDSYYDTGEYYKMFPAATAAGNVADGRTSYYLREMANIDGNGGSNPVAIANRSWARQKTYEIVPQFSLTYKLMGKDDEKTQLDYRGEVYMNVNSYSNNDFYPAELTSKSWSEGINRVSSGESNSMRFTTRHDLTFTPKFHNLDHAFMTMVRMELTSSSSNSQNLSAWGLNGGITDPTAAADLKSASTSTGRSHSIGILSTSHYSYKGGLYSLDFTLRADGSTKFGADNRWGFFPAISGRWNISDEYFFKPLEKYISMLSFRPGWGMVGNSPGAEGLMFNKYSSAGSYGASGIYMNAIAPQNLKLTSLRWEKTTSWNLGFNLGLLKNVISFDFNVYGKNTTDLLENAGFPIPSSTGFTSLAYANVGSMRNEGWELNANTRNLIKVGKFSMDVKFNIAQNRNRITDMDASLLASKNTDINYSSLQEKYPHRVQIGNALGSMYGFRYLGVYRYDYDHSGYFSEAEDYKNQMYKGNTAFDAEARGENNTCPIARDANGNIFYDAQGNPLPIYYNYGGVNYKFSGGDAIYEDINHDGQINELDIVYIGQSTPKLNGGFGFDFKFGRWDFKTSFNFRIGNNIINLARMKAEDMLGNDNQSYAVSWRWRKNGDITEIPRAMNSQAGASYNALPSDRYVEKGDYVRMQYLQLAYNFDMAKLKRYGIKTLRLSGSANNLFFLTKYLGTDPEHGQSGYGPATDSNQTPRSRSFTLSLNVGF